MGTGFFLDFSHFSISGQKTRNVPHVIRPHPDVAAIDIPSLPTAPLPPRCRIRE
ncbi:hypothetical protein AN958_08416 [Leucoagaricus sp. SymC.cos]|nr:hypothetical protein AN958_08416 [Leucoagaricus sp. SymC.cos]